MDINWLDIILLSFYLIPNLISIITPFILIFGLLLCFIKLSKDNVGKMWGKLYLQSYKRTLWQRSNLYLKEKRTLHRYM